MGDTQNGQAAGASPNGNQQAAAQASAQTSAADVVNYKWDETAISDTDGIPLGNGEFVSVKALKDAYKNKAAQPQAAAGQQAAGAPPPATDTTASFMRYEVSRLIEESVKENSWMTPDEMKARLQMLPKLEIHEIPQAAKKILLAEEKALAERNRRYAEFNAKKAGADNYTPPPNGAAATGKQKFDIKSGSDWANAVAEAFAKNKNQT